MRIVGSDILIKAVRRHPDAATALRAWNQVAQEADWLSLTEIRQTYPSADGVRTKSGSTVTVFNIRGNRYRLLTWIAYRAQLVTVINVLTHAEYDKELWKQRL